MILSTKEGIIVVIVIGVVTFLTRAIPFILFPAGKKKPEYINYLGNVLPYSMIGMLVIYCLKSVKILVYPYGIPELIGVSVVAILHLWKKNILLSILGGTIIYMLILRLV